MILPIQPGTMHCVGHMLVIQPSGDGKLLTVVGEGDFAWGDLDMVVGEVGGGW
jgi:hypothetical protein